MDRPGFLAQLTCLIADAEQLLKDRDISERKQVLREWLLHIREDPKSRLPLVESAGDSSQLLTMAFGDESASSPKEVVSLVASVQSLQRHAVRAKYGWLGVAYFYSCASGRSSRFK